jgi:fucose permease
VSASLSRPRAATALLALAYLAFISLVRDAFALPQALLGAPLAMGAAAYLVSGLNAGALMQRVGVGALLAGSTALVAVGVLGYAAAPRFALLLAAAPLVGFGSGAIDSALNAHAARAFSPRHMSWLHAAYAAGAMAGPAAMTSLLGQGASWRVGYAAVGAALVCLAVAFTFTRRRWSDDAQAPLQGPRATVRSALGDARVWLQIAIFFFYSGVEVSAGSWSFTLLTESRGVELTAAGSWVTAYWGGLLAGRVVLGIAVEHLGQERLLRLATTGVVFSALLFGFAPRAWSPLALPLLSFCLAPIFPGLMAETPRRVGPLAEHSVGFQVSAATAGVVVGPNLCGLLGARFGLEAIPLAIAAAAVGLWALHEALVVSTRR